MLAATRLATAMGLVLLAASLGTAAAQPPEKVPRVGYISPGSSSDPFRLRRFEAFRQGLRELGYVEGRNIALEPRWAEGKYDRYPALAADLVRLKVHVIVAVGGRATQVTQQATKTTPRIRSLTDGGRAPGTARWSLPNYAVERTAGSHALAAAAHRERWADQSESATIMTTQAVIFARGGGLLTWDGRL